MSKADRLREKKRLLEEIKDDLKDVHPRRLRRRAVDARHDRNEKRERKDELLEAQEEAVELLDRYERWLERLQDLDPENDPDIDRSEKYLIAEIDLLHKEIPQRRRRLKQIRRDQKRLTKRFNALDEKAEAHRKRQRNLKQRKRRVLDVIEDLERELAEKPDLNWPPDIVVAELLYHIGHCHFASPERGKLIQIGRIAVSWGIRVGEFPPFDPVECVHADPGSWHYRDSSNPGLSRSCSNRGDGLAMDLNDLDGGSDKEIAFYRTLVAKY
jgi:hypothetical protein